MIISGISIRRKKDTTGKENTSFVYHLSDKTDYGYKPFYDFWSRDAITDAEVGSECEPILGVYNGDLKIFGLRLI